VHASGQAGPDAAMAAEMAGDSASHPPPNAIESDALLLDSLSRSRSIEREMQQAFARYAFLCSVGPWALRNSPDCEKLET
jgi:hypothetical protein